jgi:uncharacterized SAM-binding protein YcdF (DUF218 family)
MLKRSRYVRFRAAAGLAGILLIGFAVRYSGETLVVSRHVDRPNVIVVLASHEWERLPTAAQLARENTAAQVLLTLPVHVTSSNCHDCSQRVTWLSEAGIDPNRVTVLSQRVTNTHDEANAAAAWVHRHQIDRVVIVTSPYHARRALATFRHLFDLAGIRADIGLETPLAGVHPTRWWLRAYERQYVTYEWAGIVYYAIRFGVSPFV